MSFEIVLGVFVGIPFGIIVGMIVGAALEHRAWLLMLETLPDVLTRPEVAEYLEDLRRLTKEQPS